MLHHHSFTLSISLCAKEASKTQTHSQSETFTSLCPFSPHTHPSLLRPLTLSLSLFLWYLFFWNIFSLSLYFCHILSLYIYLSISFSAHILLSHLLQSHVGLWPREIGSRQIDFLVVPLLTSFPFILSYPSRVYLSLFSFVVLFSAFLIAHCSNPSSLGHKFNPLTIRLLLFICKLT